MRIIPIEPILRKNLLMLAHAYAAIRGRKRGRPLKLQTVSKYLYGDEPFFENVAKGRGFNILSYDAIVAKFIKRWPKDEPIPKIINPVSRSKK